MPGIRTSARTAPGSRPRRSTRSTRAASTSETWWSSFSHRTSELCHLLVSDFQNRQERFLGNLDGADALHALLAFLLLLEQLALARNVSAVALGEHVLTEGLDRLAGDDARANRRLDRHLEHLPRDQLAHLRGEHPAAIVGAIAMHDD